MTSILVEQLSLDFPVLSSDARSLRNQFIINPIRQALALPRKVGGEITVDNGGTVVKALKNINFKINDGDRVGLIGQNGSGKTTLLRVLAGIYEPSQGEITVDGMVLPLLNIQEGVSGDLSGRGLIKKRAILLGLNQEQTETLTEDVIDFCDLGEYIDMPVRTYSAGMLVRVTFGVITGIKSNILLFDEFIGAGDANFQDKSKTRIEKFIGKAGIMVLASHDRELLNNWCNRSMVFHAGQLVFDGKPQMALDFYDEMRLKNGSY